MAESAPRLPVLVLAGFLGSGKTTLLNRLLRDPACADAAVLVNEFGEAGLDHQLVLHARDRLVVLPGGCVCCALREDVEGALRELFEQRDSGRIVPFRRIVIETTGLADPVPLLLTLQSFGLARARLQRAQVLATVDALLGVATLARFTEAVRQVAAADVVLLTKTDLADAAQEASARAAVEALNPWCPVLGTRSGPDAPPTPSAPVEAATLLRALDAAADAAPEAAGAPPPAGRLDATAGRYRPVAGAAAHAACSFALRLDEPLDWGAFGVWLTALLHRHGERILRVKGIIAVAGLAAPVVFHAAQHMVHPPQHLPAWPSDDRRSHIVFIVLGLEPERIRRSLQAFNRVATRLAAAPPLARVKPAGAGGTVAGRPVRRPTAPSWIRG